MWRWLSNKILRNRLAFIIAIGLITIYMAYEGSKLQLSYEFARVLPSDDTTYIEYEGFKKLFGEDGSVMVIGLKDSNLFKLEKFNGWYTLANTIKNIEGIKEVMSVGSIYNIAVNDSLKRFEFNSLVKGRLSTQQEVDSVKIVLESLPFYEGLIYNRESGATIMAITFAKKDLNSQHRIEIVNEIKALAAEFEKNHGIELHYSGMPFIRTEYMNKVSGEMKIFLILAIIVTAAILWVFFRSFSSVFFSVVVVAVGVVWSIGIIHLLGYKITILSGLIPPLIMVIGVPNCIFLINKYHSEYTSHHNRIKALARTIETIGVTLFLANITTAIGFGVLYFTNSSLLVEFGVVAAINTMTTYFITLILIPIILSFLPVPSAKHTKHLEAKRINKILDTVVYLVTHKRKAIYVTLTIITAVSIYGMNKINVIGFVVDDLPKKDRIYTDLSFFEDNFNGVLPFEIFIDTKKENGVFAENGAALYKIKRLQKIFAEYPDSIFSKPISVVEAIKFSYQGYKNGASKYYILPPPSELQKLKEYLPTLKGRESRLQTFLDSTNRYTRVSIQMADVGSKRIKEIMNDIRPRVDSIFEKENYTVNLTGHSLMFLKGNDYLLKNLLESLLIEIILITLVGLALFRSLRIILLSKLPCLIPLVITAGIMGFAGINFKPSTILIFSIAFGISSDGTIYFLTRYRQELKKRKISRPEAIAITIKDTGISMFYTAIILFCGFGIFAASSFGGTVALGILISLTLIMALCTNLLLLPALLLSINKVIAKKEILEEPLIEIEAAEEE